MWSSEKKRKTGMKCWEITFSRCLAPFIGEWLRILLEWYWISFTSERSTLCQCLRVLLTTSRDHLIPLSFRQVSLRIPIETGNLPSHEPNIDIQRFFEQRFAEIACMSSSLQSWHGPPTDRLCCRFVHLGRNSCPIFEAGFSRDKTRSFGAFREGGDIIDQLYLQILQLSFPNSQVLYTLRRVVDAIVLAPQSPPSRI